MYCFVGDQAQHVHVGDTLRNTQPVQVVPQQICNVIRWCPAIYKTCSSLSTDCIHSNWQIGRPASRLLQLSTLETMKLSTRTTAGEVGMNLRMVLIRRSW